jgi:hypothetical protein
LVIGKKAVSAPGDEEPAVINLMDALRRSLDQAQHGAPVNKRGKEARATRKHARAGARRKTG